MWKKDDNDAGSQHVTDTLTTYTQAVEEFSSSATDFLTHMPLLTKARDAYHRAMAVSAQLRHILDKGDETLRLLMSQMEQAVNLQLDADASDKKAADQVKVETSTANGSRADAARA
jgi:exonuclease VII small subunit